MNAIPLQEKPQAQTKWKDAHELKEAVQQWGDRIKVQVKQIQLRPMKRKWGSISTTGNLTLNTELLDLPKELGEFVIVHELVHLLPITGRCLNALCMLICLTGKNGSNGYKEVLNRGVKNTGIASSRIIYKNIIA